MEEINEKTKKRIMQFLNTAMVQKVRDDKTKYYCFNEETEFNKYWEEIKSILFKGGFEIYDFYYNTLADAFNDIAYFLKSSDDLTKFEDEVYNYAEADISYYDLINWLMFSDNIGAVNEAVNEHGVNNKDFDLISYIQIAQHDNKLGVYYMALEVIKYLLDLFDSEAEEEGV